jgi:hypothetical protein
MLIKVQLIDFKTGQHCYPKDKKIKTIGGIKMLDASVIPLKENEIATITCSWTPSA